MRKSSKFHALSLAHSSILERSSLSNRATACARLTGHIRQEGRRRTAKWGAVTMCIGGGQGGAGLFEIYS